jgi:hypothetical protein
VRCQRSWSTASPEASIRTTLERRLSTWQDEAAFRIAGDGMALQGWRAERSRVRADRPLEGFVGAARVVPRAS